MRTVHWQHFSKEETYMEWSLANGLDSWQLEPSPSSDEDNDPFFGVKVTDNTSPPAWMHKDARFLGFSRKSHSRAVLSSDPLSRQELSSETARDRTGAVWPWYFEDVNWLSPDMAEQIWSEKVGWWVWNVFKCDQWLVLKKRMMSVVKVVEGWSQSGLVCPFFWLYCPLSLLNYDCTVCSIKSSIRSNSIHYVL